MRVVRFIHILSIGLFFVAIQAHAGNRLGATTITLGGGYYFFSPKRHIENTGIPFAAVAYQLTDRWSVEGLLGIYSTKSRKNMDEDKQVQGTLVSFNGLYHLPVYCNLEPYVLAGAGVIGMHPNGNDANNTGNLNAGAGVQIFVDESIAFRFEARDFYTMVNSYNDIFLSGGVSFLF